MTRLSTWLAPAALLLGAGLLSAPASAAPAGALTGLQAPGTSNVEHVTFRSGRCYWHRGHRHCRPAFRRYGYYDTPYYQPYYGYGPTIGFSFGGGRHFHGGHRHRGGHGHGRR